MRTAEDDCAYVTSAAHEHTLLIPNMITTVAKKINFHLKTIAQVI
jgi:hypothetical protein